jgi:hypothetical protein
MYRILIYKILYPRRACDNSAGRVTARRLERLGNAMHLIPHPTFTPL